MKYFDFKNQAKAFPLFYVDQFMRENQNKQVFKNQLSQWKRRGLIIPLKKGLYILNQHDRRITPSREFIANQLVFPSYVSLEYALSFYGIIPEKVYQVTSITSKKTTEFTNDFGTFVYRNLKPDLFFGFCSFNDENQLPFLLAEKEKALLDLLYLNLSRIDISNLQFLESFYRMENLDTMNKTLIFQYTENFKSKKLSYAINTYFNTNKIS